MQKHKVQIFDVNIHRQALYAHYVERAGYEAVLAKKLEGGGAFLANSAYAVVSLPTSLDERVHVLKQLLNAKSRKPLFVLDSVGFVHEQFKDLALVGHINRHALSLSQTLTELTNSLKSILK